MLKYLELRTLTWRINNISANKISIDPLGLRREDCNIYDKNISSSLFTITTSALTPDGGLINGIGALSQKIAQNILQQAITVKHENNASMK